MIFDFLQGKKTYIIAAAGIIWGLYTRDYSTIFVALGLMGLRNGLSTELKKLVQPEEKPPVEQPVQDTNLPIAEPVATITQSAEPQVFG